MGLRVAVFAAWAAVGALISYGSLSAFTIFVIFVLAVAAAAASLIPRVHGRRLPEASGVLMGPAALCVVVGGQADSALPWLAAASVLTAICLLAYAVTSRRAPYA